MWEHGVAKVESFFSYIAAMGYSDDDTPQERARKLRYVMALTINSVIPVLVLIHLGLTVQEPMLIGGTTLIQVSFILGFVLYFIFKRPFVDLITFGAFFGVIILDLYQSAIVDTGRAWPAVVVIMDLRLLLEGGNFGSNLIVGFTTLYILVDHIGRAVPFGLQSFFASAEERRQYINCEEPPCTKPPVVMVQEYTYFLASFVVDYLLTRFFAKSTLENQARIQASIETAEKVALSLAEFDLERARASNSGANLPEGLRVAFECLINNLASYKPFLPDHCLPEMLRDEEDEMPSDSTTTLKTDHSTSCSAQLEMGSSGMGTGRVTLLAANLRRFLVLDDAMQRAVHMEFVALLGEMVRCNKGLVDSFSGDRVLASFNGARICRTHAVSAVRAAGKFHRGWDTLSVDCEASIGIATGRASCGVLGTDHKGYAVFGAVACTVHVIERWATQHNVKVLCSGATMTDSVGHFEARLHMHRLRLTKYPDASLELWEVVAEVEAAEAEWMYQLDEIQGGKWGSYNQAVKLVHEGRYLEATMRLSPHSPVDQMLKQFLSQQLAAGACRPLTLLVTEVGVPPEVTPLNSGVEVLAQHGLLLPSPNQSPLSGTRVPRNDAFPPLGLAA